MRNLLLLHGALGDTSEFEVISSLLSQSGINCIPFTFSGHGRKPFSKTFGITAFTDELRLFIDKNDLKGTSVLGYSMGGYVAIYLQTQQEYFSKIITVGTKLDWDKETVEKQISWLNPAQLKLNQPGFVEQLILKHGEEWETLVTSTVEMISELGAKKWLSPEKLSALKIPLLFGIGDKDTMVTRRETENAFKAVKGAGMFILPYSKHPLQSIDHKVLVSILLSFLSK